jgi:hypothetical protein
MLKKMDILDGKNSRRRPKKTPPHHDGDDDETPPTQSVRKRTLCPIPEYRPLETQKYRRGTGPEAEAKMKRVQRRCHEKAKIVFSSDRLLGQMLSNFFFQNTVS